MNYCEFPEANWRPGAPKDWDEEKNGKCGVLPVQITEDGRCISLWMPDADERAKIARGHPLALTVHGGQPVVALSVSESHLIQDIDDHGRENKAGYSLARRRLRSDVEEHVRTTGRETFTKAEILALLGDVAALN